MLHCTSSTYVAFVLVRNGVGYVYPDCAGLRIAYRIVHKYIRKASPPSNQKKNGSNESKSTHVSANNQLTCLRMCSCNVCIDITLRLQR